MRSRLLVVPFIAVLFLICGTVASASARPVLAQPAGGSEEESETGTTSGEEETQTEEGSEEGEGQDEPEAETGAGEGSSEEAATETGPPWTYQMARILLVLLVFLGLGIGLLYWRLIVSRQRGAA
ncbi:MAG: hypothetical protein ACRDI3_06330 [Actinomycetota bacterium]